MSSNFTLNINLWNKFMNVVFFLTIDVILYLSYFHSTKIRLVLIEDLNQMYASFSLFMS